jgi:predicted permease
MRAAFFRDLQYAARLMRRSPGFSAAVVLTLALGVGASTAIFSAVYGMLFRPLPYRDADRLVVIAMERVLEGVHRPVRTFFPLADLGQLQSRTHVFDSIAFYSTEQSVLSHNGFTQKVDSAWVSESFFATVGGRIQSGRGLAPSGIDRASVVISDRLRQRLFGADNAVGRPLTVGGRSYEIVGVAHQTFQLPSQSTDVWLPAVELACCSYVAIARLGPEVSPSQAAADVNAVVPALTAKSPRLYAGVHASVAALRDELTGDVRAALWVLLASVGLLLGVACANATNLLFARNAARSRETAVRIALGASRGRLLAQSFAEAVLAVTAAAALGMLMAVGLIDALISLGAPGLPRLDAETVRIDLPVFIFALGIAAATTAVMGWLPAIRSGSVVDALKMGAPGMSAGPSRRRLRNGLVIVQLAVSVVLLVGASLLGRSLVRLMTTDIGVRTDRVATAAINLSYQRRLTDAQLAPLVEAIVERVRSLPNVQAAGAGAGLPPKASTIRLTLKRFGDTVDYQATAVPATPGYFSALGVRLLKGRLFSEADAGTQKQVMIMTADTARRFFDVDDPIGRTMLLPVLRNGILGTAEMTLVGVVANVKHSGLQAAPDDTVYRPLRQQPWPLLFLVARTSADPSVLASVLRREIAAIDPAIAVSSVSTLDAIVAGEAAQPRFRSALLTALAALTLAIATVGLYGVVAHTVSQRTREFGVRMALGADRVDLLTLVFLEGARLAGAGMVAGVAGSLATTRMLASLLYGIEPTDAFSFGLASGLLLIVTAAATYVPARRAARLNPTAALRAE